MLSNDVGTRLRPHLEPVEFQRGEHLFQPDQQLGHAFFFNGGLSSEISVVTATKPLRSGVHRVGRPSERSGGSRCRQHAAFRVHAMRGPGLITEIGSRQS